MCFAPDKARAAVACWCPGCSFNCQHAQEEIGANGPLARCCAAPRSPAPPVLPTFLHVPCKSSSRVASRAVPHNGTRRRWTFREYLPKYFTRCVSTKAFSLMTRLGALPHHSHRFSSYFCCDCYSGLQTLKVEPSGASPVLTSHSPRQTV